jgi:hypothetical protein
MKFAPASILVQKILGATIDSNIKKAIPVTGHEGS